MRRIAQDSAEYSAAKNEADVEEFPKTCAGTEIFTATELNVVLIAAFRKPASNPSANYSMQDLSRTLMQKASP